MAKKSFEEVWGDTSYNNKKSFEEVWGSPLITEQNAQREIRKTSPFSNVKKETVSTISEQKNTSEHKMPENVQNINQKNGANDSKLGGFGKTIDYGLEQFTKGAADRVAGHSYTGSFLLDKLGDFISQSGENLAKAAEPFEEINNNPYITNMMYQNGAYNPQDIINTGEFMNEASPELKKAADKLSDWSKQSKYNEKDLSAIDKTIGAMSSSFGGIAVDAVPSAIHPILGPISLAAGVFGNSYNKAKSEGATDSEAVAYGLGVAGTELALEKLTGGIKTYGDGILDNITQKWVTNSFNTKTGKAVADLFSDAVGEGFEELLSEYIGEFLTDIYQDATTKEDAITRIVNTTPDAMFSFLIGALTSGVLNTPGLVGDLKAGPQAKPEATTQESTEQKSNNIIEQNQPVIEQKKVETDPMKAMINENAKAEAQKIVEKPSETKFDNNFLEKGLKSDNVAIKMESQRINTKMIKQYGERTDVDVQWDDIAKTMNALGIPYTKVQDFIDGEIDALGESSPKGIKISNKAERLSHRIAVHEILHNRIQPGAMAQEVSTELRKLAALDNVSIDVIREDIIQNYAKRKKPALSESALEEEIDAKIAEKYLFTENGIKGLVRSNLSLAEKIHEIIRAIRIKVSGTALEKQLLKTEQLYKKALKESKNMPTEVRKMYAGPGAKNADLTALERAKQMESENIDKDTIWKNTGWVKKADGKWRFEISDRETVYSFYELKELGETTLGRIMFNAKLYENYPFLEDIPVVMDDMLDDNAAGAYSPVFGTIKLNDNISEDKLITTLLHEVQHAIQQYEDFQSGTNLKDARTEVIKKVDEKIASFEKKNPGFKELFDEYDDLVDGYSDALGAVGTAQESEIIEAVTDGKFDNFADYDRALFKMRKNIWDKYGKTSMQDYRKILEENNYRNYLEEYQNNLGEVEARDTQARRKMTAEERRQNLPKTEGYVTVNDAIEASSIDDIDELTDEEYYESPSIWVNKKTYRRVSSALSTYKPLTYYKKAILHLSDMSFVVIYKSHNDFKILRRLTDEQTRRISGIKRRSSNRNVESRSESGYSSNYSGWNGKERNYSNDDGLFEKYSSEYDNRPSVDSQSRRNRKTEWRGNTTSINEDSAKVGSFFDESFKKKQLDIILENNPMTDDYHVGIRSVDDIKTFEEAMQDDESFVWGDFSVEDAQDALEQGEVMVYSSRPMNQGNFVSTSYNQARDYAGGGKVYSKVMKLSDIAWINGDEGQIAQVTNDIDSNSPLSNNKNPTENDDIRYAINSNIMERAKDPSVRARAQMEKRIRHTFLFNNKSNPLKMYDVTSRIEDEFERTGKISEDLRKELFTTAYEETLRSSDVSYKELPEFKQMLQEDLNRVIYNYENTLIKERELKKFAEENDIDASQIKFNPATGFLKNVKPEELPDKIISYKKLKASLKSDLIGQVNNYAGGKAIDELIDKAAIEIVEDGFISSPTKFKIRQEMIENGYSINADAMNDNKELYDFIKSTKFNVPRGFGREIQEYERTKKLLKTSTMEGQPIDTVYKELRSKFGEFFPDGLTNQADQYQQIYDVMADLEPVRLMLEDSDQYNADMRQYLEDNFTDRLEDFKNQILYRSQKDYYDRAAKKQVAYDEAINEVSEKISEKFFKDNQEIDELKKSEHTIKGASIDDLSEIVAKIQDRGALSKTLAQNLDAMANGDVVLRAKLSEIFEKPLRQAKRTYVTNQKRVLNDVYKRIVTDLGIKMGSKESAAMMWYGEGKKQLNKVKGKVESDKLEFTPYTLDDLKKDFPKTWENIVAADKIMREYYDDYVDRINESLQKVYAESVLKESVNEKRTQIQKDIREAQERLEQLKAQRTGEVGGPDLEARINAQRKRISDLSRQFNNVAEDVYRNKRLKKRSDYYHHFQEVGFAENIQQILNVDSANNIANALAGISEFTKPKSKWEKFMQRRSDVARYEEDAIKGFLKYAPAAEYKISFDPYVAQLRGTIQDMIKLSDEANINNAKAINWLTNYTNSLAGKTNPMDRWLAHTESGRTVLQFLNKVNARVKANAVVGNLNSAVSQFYNLPNGTAVLTANGGAKAMTDIAKGSKDYSTYVAKKMSGQDVSDNPINQSVFLQERFIDSTIDQFDERLIHKPAQAATFLLTFGDQVVAEQLWFSAYNQAQRLGKNDPIAYADDLVARAVGGRGIGEVPLMQQSQVVKLIAPFQVEVNNAYQLMKQLGAGALKDKDKLMALVVMYGITWIMNEINEALTGNRVGMDIYNAMQDIVDNWDAEKNPIANTFTAAGRLTGEILSNVPMGAQVAQMVVPDEYDREKLFGEADPSRYGTGNIGINAISDPLTQLATGQNIDWQSLVTNFVTPMGGKQLNRMYKMAEDAGLIPRVDINTSEGLQTSWKPGAYNDKGELKYQIDTSDPLNILKGFVFGTYATKEGKEYLDNEYSALSEKKTTLYESAVEAGADPVEFYNALREANYSRNLVDKNGESIDNSKAAMNREALERNNSFDEVKELIESGQAKASDFGLNNAVFEWTQEEFNRFLKSLNK